MVPPSLRLGVLLALLAAGHPLPAQAQDPTPNALSTPFVPPLPVGPVPDVAVTNPPASTGPDAAPLDEPAPQPGVGPATPGLVTGTGPAASGDAFACGQPGTPGMAAPVLGEARRYTLLRNGCAGHGDVWAVVDQDGGASFEAGVDLSALGLDARTARLARAGRATLFVLGVAERRDVDGAPGIAITVRCLLRSVPEPSQADRRRSPSRSRRDPGAGSR